MHEHTPSLATCSMHLPALFQEFPSAYQYFCSDMQITVRGVWITRLTQETDLACSALESLAAFACYVNAPY